MSWYEVIETGEVKILRLNSDVEKVESKEIETFFSDLCSDKKYNIVLDLKSISSLNKSFYRNVVLLVRTLKENGKTLASLNVSRSLRGQLSTDGVVQVFKPIDNAEQIKNLFEKQTKKAPKIDVNFLNPFIEATIDTFGIQVNLEVAPASPKIRSSNSEPETPMEIAGILSLVCEVFSGSLCICFPKETFTAVYEQMFDEKIDTINDENQDVVGELMNIIFGQAKAKLNQMDGYGIQPALPTVVRGKSIALQHMSRSLFVLPFTSPAGPFEIQISISD